MPTAQPNPKAPLVQRLTELATTLQFAWFVGHVFYLASTLRYVFSSIKFNAGSTGARFSYRLAFVSAIVTYGIVVFKAYRSRLTKQPGGVQPAALATDENIQYLVLSLVWLFSAPIFWALLPFAVYSTFHFLSYLRAYLLPALMPPPAAPASATSPSGTPSRPPAPPLADAIAKFVKQNYDASMHLVSRLELALLARLFFGAILMQNSWIILVLYTVFVRVRYAQSAFMRSAVAYVERAVDGLFVDQRVPEGVRGVWGTFKGVVRIFGEKTDFIAPKKTE